MSFELSELLRQARDALQSGDNGEARLLLRRATELDDTSVEAWLLLTSIVTAPDQKILCLEKVLAIDPDNETALAELSKLKAVPPKIPLDTDATIPSESISISAHPEVTRYKVGGTVETGTQEIYVKRAADEELYQRCLAGEYSFILTSRQRGKSSLRVRTKERLDQVGIHTATVDLQRFGRSGMTVDRFYVTFLSRIVRELGDEIDIKPSAWWQEQQTDRYKTAAELFDTFLHDLILPSVDSPLVIFVDEIDSMRAMPFETDDFFALIRGMHESRADHPLYRKLTFVLIGAAQPNDLIKDPERTPFNIGKQIILEDFTLGESAILSAGLGLSEHKASEVNQWVYEWAHGHPFLSQSIYRQLAGFLTQNPTHTATQAVINSIVQGLFFNRSRTNEDSNLGWVSKELKAQKKEIGLLPFVMFHAIRQGHIIMDDDMGSVASKEVLKLAGIVRVDSNGQLVIRNRIYELYFDDDWIAGAIGEDIQIPPHLFLTQQVKDLLESMQRQREYLSAQQEIAPPPPTAPLETTQEGAAELEFDWLTAFIQSADRIQQNKVNASAVSEPPQQDPSEFNLAFLTLDENQQEVYRLIQQAKTQLNSDPEAAHELLSKAVEIDESSVDAWLLLSEIAETTEEKQAHLEKVLELEPSNAKAQRNLNALRDKTTVRGESRLGRITSGVFEPVELALSDSEKESTPFNLMLSRGEYALVLFLTALAGFTASVLFLIPGNLLFGLFIGILLLVFPNVYLGAREKRRQHRIASQLPDTLGFWVNSLRSGYSVLQSMEAIGKEGIEPTASEIRRVVMEVQLGIPMDMALDHLLARIPNEDLDLVVTAINIQREVGGNLAEILEVISHTIRERIRLKREFSVLLIPIYRIVYCLIATFGLLQWHVFASAFAPAMESNAGRFASLAAYSLLSMGVIFAAKAFSEIGSNVGIDLLMGASILGVFTAVKMPSISIVWMAALLLVILFRSHLFLLISSALSAGVVVLYGLIYIDTIDIHLPSFPRVPGSDIHIELGLSTMAVLALALFGGVLIVGVINTLRYSNKNTQDLLQNRLAEYGDRDIPSSLKEIELSMGIGTRLFHPILFGLRNLLKGLSPEHQLESIRARLGKADDLTDPNWYFASTIIVPIASGTITTCLLYFEGRWTFIHAIGWGILLAVLTYYAHYARLSVKAKRRQAKVIATLPDALDLLTICVEAGLGFEQAFGKVYEKWDNDLALSLGRVLQEIQLGLRRSEALRRMAERLDVPDVSTFTAAVIQADQLGVSISKILRIQSDQIRIKRRQNLQQKLNRYVALQNITLQLLIGPAVFLWVVAPFLSNF